MAEKKQLEFDLTSLVDNLGVETLEQYEAPSKHITTGTVLIDRLTCGGVPCGVITEVVGDFSTGKSLIGTQVCAYAQKQDPDAVTVYIDAEAALSKEWATEVLGIDPFRLIYYAAVELEATYDFLDQLWDSVPSDRQLVVVWDSLAATQPKAIRDDEGSKMGSMARVNSERFPQILRPIAERKVAFVLINQLRSKIGVSFGKQWESVGGRAVRFYSTLRLHMVRVGRDKVGTQTVGTKGRIEVIKSRISRPYNAVPFEISFERGIPPWSGMLALFKKAGLITGSGGNYRFKATRGKSKGGEQTFTRAEMPKVYKTLWRMTDPDIIELAMRPGKGKGKDKDDE